MVNNTRHNSSVAVIFAGGIGSRMGHADGPKQFIEIKEKPILIYTLEHFEDNENIDAVYIAVNASHVAHTKGLLNKFDLKKVRAVVVGGESAQESIYNGLCAATADPQNDEKTIVLIHDGVRPIINKKIINTSIESVEEYNSSISSIPAFETVAESLDGGNTVEKVTNRNLMYILQAPQAFRLNEVHEMNRRSLEDGVMGSFIDQAHMMNHYGYDLHMSEGFRGNVKITVPIDLTYFRFLIESGEYKNVTGEPIVGIK